jgi:hypothetical protein
MPFTSLAGRLATLPLVLAGPILRQVTEGSVTVWVALRESKAVRLVVKDKDDNPVLEHTSDTVKLGEHLHIVAVTARPINNGNKLSPGESYTYDLLNSANTSLLIVGDRQALTYGDASGPGFVFAPEKLEELRIAHASCRKPHGEGRDMLAHLDTLIADPQQRPHLLFLTGDQIYADDVADVLLIMLQDAVKELEVFPAEILPGIDGKDLRPGMRSDVVKNVAELTVDTAVSYSHLLTLGEYCTMYLFAWSPVLWPTSEEMKDWKFSDFFRTDYAPLHWMRVLNQEFDQTVSHLLAFRETLGGVRKALANIPTYMMFDDHDVTDDLFLHREWCIDVMTSSLGRRVIENGLSACALFQAWGNSPEQFRDGEAGAKLLGNLPQLQNREELDLILGLPSIDEINAWNMDNLEWLGPKSGAQLPSKVLKFHFALTGPNYQVLFLNTRTHRAFPAKDNKAPAELISEDGFALQIPTPSQNQPPKVLTFVVSPAPVFGVEWIDNVQLWQRLLFGRRKADYERWNLSDTCFDRFLSRTSDLGAHQNGQQKKATRTIILSGDVHYGYAAQVQYSNDKAVAAITQFTASSLKNQDWKTLFGQSRGYSFDLFSYDRKLPEPKFKKVTTDDDPSCYRLQYINGHQHPLTQFPELDATASLEQPVVPDATQIVGFNNLGVVTVKVEANVPVSATQALYWYAPDGTPVSTTYDVALLPKQVDCP